VNPRFGARALTIAILVVAQLGAAPASLALAATGDLIADVVINEPYPDNISPSVAFDGRYLYHTGYGGSVLHRINVPPRGASTTAAGQVDIPIQGSPSGIMTLSYDSGRDAFWAVGGDGLSIYLLSKTGAANLVFKIDPDTDRPGHVPSFYADEMKIAYDGEGDTVWYSPDATVRIYHYQTYSSARGSAVLVDATPFIDVSQPPNDMEPECGYSQSSGITVGGSDLFVSISGCSRLFRYSKTGAKLSSFTYNSGGGQSAQDLECDNVSYGVSVFWLRDGYDGHIRALQQPSANACRMGGGALVAPPPPSSPPPSTPPPSTPPPATTPPPSTPPPATTPPPSTPPPPPASTPPPLIPPIPTLPPLF
jgi:hypothetical protein